MIKFKKPAFTLIELLVTIVIIGILAAIGSATYKGYFEKARIAKIVQELTTIRKFLILDRTTNGTNQFLLERDFGLGTNPSIQEIIQSYGPAQKFFGANLSTDFGRGIYRYDNDGDEFNCGTGGNVGLTRGVQVFIENVTEDDAVKIAAAFDETDLTCGEIFHYQYNNAQNTGSLHYHISDDGSY